MANVILNQSSLTRLPLPRERELESVALLKQVARAHRYLAELKGVAKTIPNEAILISTLSMQEAKDSSAIENIFTTHDELFKADIEYFVFGQKRIDGSAYPVSEPLHCQ